MNWWNIIKRTFNPFNNVNIGDWNIGKFIRYGISTEQEWATDKEGFDKWLKILELAGFKGDKNFRGMPSDEVNKYTMKGEIDGEMHIVPRFWDSSTGWNMQEIKNELDKVYEHEWLENQYKDAAEGKQTDLQLQSNPSAKLIPNPDYNPNMAPPPPGIKPTLQQQKYLNE